MARTQQKYNRFLRNPDAPTSCNGGSTYLDSHGYVWEKAPEHPKCNSHGYIQQHRLVAEQKLGRFLSGLEVVHHKDQNRANNSPENLEVLASRALHGIEHAEDVRERFQANLTEEQVKEALLGRTTSAAAKLLGVHHMTLRNRFPHLLKLRNSPNFLDAQAMQVCSFAMQQPDVFEAVRILAAKHQCHAPTIHGSLQRWSKQDGPLGELARQVRSRLRRRAGPKRKPSRPSYT